MQIFQRSDFSVYADVVHLSLRLGVRLRLQTSRSSAIVIPIGGLYDYNASNKVLVIWNHLLTVDTEIQFFWSRKITAPSALFLTIRYLTLSWAIYGTPWFYGISTSKVKNSSLLKGLDRRSFGVLLQG